jgi:hypothetical protein
LHTTLLFFSSIVIAYCHAISLLFQGAFLGGTLSAGAAEGEPSLMVGLEEAPTFEAITVRVLKIIEV